MTMCRLRRLVRVILILLIFASAVELAGAYTLPFGPWPKLEVNSNNTLSFNLNQVSGSSSYFSDDNAGHDQTFNHSSNLFLTGELYKDWQVEMSLSDDRYAPDKFKWKTKYNGKDASVLVGEFNANMGGNEFMPLNRSLTGAQIDVNVPRGSLSLLASDFNTPVRTDTFYGQNVSGPYYLTASPIVDGSEIVTVNDQRKAHYTDYTIDYYNGILNFSAGTIISPADKVTVSYEAASSGLGGGRLYAMRGSYPIFDNLVVGVNHLRMDGGSSENSEREVRDQFYADGTPGPYYLTARPIVAASEVVTLNGVQIPAVDNGVTNYTLDLQTGHLLFANGHQPGINTLITVRYKVQVLGVGGNSRSVTGMDVNYTMHNGLSMNLQAAKSGDDNAADSSRDGGAIAIGANYNGSRISASTKFRDVSSTFTPMEAVGYRNVDRDWTWTLNYAPSSMLSFATTGTNARQPLNPYSTEPSSNDIAIDQRDRTYTLDFHRAGWPQLVYQRLTRDANRVDDSSLFDQSTTDLLRLVVSRQHFTGSLEFNRVKTDSNQLSNPSDASSTLFQYRGVTDNAALNLQYQPSDRLNMSFNAAANRIKANSTNGLTDTSGRNAQFNAAYRATDTLNFNASMTMNQTGATAGLDGAAIAALRDRTFTLGADWRPLTNFTAGLNYNNTRTEGDNYSNSQTENYTANLGWQPHPLLNLNAYGSHQILSYLGTSGGSTSNLVGINTEIGPMKKIRVSLNAQHLWGETQDGVNTLLSTTAASMRTVTTDVAQQYATTATGNRLTTLGARVSYAIAPRQEIFVNGDTMLSSGYPSKSTKFAYSLGWSYHLQNNLIFTLNAGRVTYKDEANSSLDYRANQLNAQLSWNF